MREASLLHLKVIEIADELKISILDTFIYTCRQMKYRVQRDQDILNYAFLKTMFSFCVAPLIVSQWNVNTSCSKSVALMGIQ